MNVTIRFNVLDTVLLLMVVINLAVFGYHVGGGHWFAYFNLFGGAAVMTCWSDEFRRASGGKVQ